jgi:hypothetical protein
MKTYVIILSEKFPTTHPRKGQETEFGRSFLNGKKIHTIRGNFSLWEKRIAQIQKGEAVLSVRQWTGKPYQSKQVEIARLTAEDGVGIQELKLTDLSRPTTINGQRIELPLLAQNDGLSFNDWFNWFIGYDLSKPLAIIHFTKFRY